MKLGLAVYADTAALAGVLKYLRGIGLAPALVAFKIHEKAREGTADHSLPCFAKDRINALELLFALKRAGCDCLVLAADTACGLGEYLLAKAYTGAAYTGAEDAADEMRKLADIAKLLISPALPRE